MIPPDLRPILNSSGIDEKVATDFIVDSPIDSFRENISKLPAGPEVKDRLKEVRRQGKNRTAAKKSRQNQMARMSQLRERHKSLTKQLSDIKHIEKKIQVRKNIECMNNAPGNKFVIVFSTKIILKYVFILNYTGITEKVSKIFTNAF